MDLLAIELNDVGIRAARPSDGDALLAVDESRDASPGVALIGREGLVTGVAAARQSCLRPLEANTRYWDQLDVQPAEPKNPASPNRAEVACAHLGQVAQAVHRPGDEVVIAVPASWDQTQLGLVAGIARELELPLRALVASPVAVAPTVDLHGTVLVFDLMLHRSVLSLVDVSDGAHLVRLRVCPDVGQRAVQRQWIKAISGEFVRSTRFDPLHDAATEQQLHDALPPTLEHLRDRDSCVVQLRTESLSPRVTVTGQLLANAAQSLVFRLGSEVQALMSDERFTAILLGDDAARVPGLRSTLERQGGVPVHVLEPGAAARGLARHWPGRYDQSVTHGVAYHAFREPEGLLG